LWTKSPHTREPSSRGKANIKELTRVSVTSCATDPVHFFMSKYCRQVGEAPEVKFDPDSFMETVQAMLGEQYIQT